MIEKSRVLALAVATAATAALITTTCAASAATASPSGSAGSSGAAATSGTVDFTSYTDNDGVAFKVILTGAIGDYGTGVTVLPNGTLDPEHEHQMQLELKNGTFKFDISAVDAAFVAALSHGFPPPATCAGTASASGAAPIMAGSGTGAYQGIGGTLDLTISVSEIFQTPSCTPLLNEELTITGSGKLTW